MWTLPVTRKGGIYFVASFSTFFCLILYLHINSPLIKFVEIPSLFSDTKWSYEIQAERLGKIQETCQNFLGIEGEKRMNFYGGRAPVYDQKLILSAFLMADKPKTILCYNHKVASTSGRPKSSVRFGTSAGSLFRYTSVLRRDCHFGKTLPNRIFV